MATDFKHPKEQAAWKTLTENPVFQFVVDGFQSLYTDLTDYANMKGRNFLVTRETSPQLHRLYQTAARRLGVVQEVPLYVQFDYALQIETVGTDGDCAIVLTSACLEECSEAQLLALFGRELAHIRYRHIRMLNIHKLFDKVLQLVPVVGGAASQLFQTLLLQWRQYASYTADRGAAIAAQSTDGALEALSAAMGMRLDSTGAAAVLEQRAEADQPAAEMSLAGKAILQMMISKIPVPFGVWRMQELKRWCESKECKESFPTVYYSNYGRLGPQQRSDTGSLYKQAVLMQARDPEGALTLLHAAAGSGCAQAQAQLGQYYLTGKAGLPRQLHTGLTLLQAAASRGSISAWFGLGVCLRNGLGTALEKDEKRALWMFRLAEAGGHPKAGAYLAGCRPVPLHESMISRVMHWFSAGFAGGPCLIGPDDPARGLGDIPDDIRSFLWIPAGERVLALERKTNAAGKLRDAIAVTPIGIYWRAEPEEPNHLTWAELCRCKMDGSVKKDTVTLRIGEKPLWTYHKDLRLREAGTLILRIRRLLDPTGSQPANQA